MTGCSGYMLRHMYEEEQKKQQYIDEQFKAQNKRLLNTVPSFCLSQTHGISLKTARAVCERAKHQSCFECAEEFVDKETH